MIELFSLSGRTALVTGASSGLGRHFARVLVRAGASVVVAARRLDALHALVNEISGAGGKAVAVALDVTEPDKVAAAFDAAEQAFGTVDVLINNAGVAEPHYFLEETEENWRNTLDVNLSAVWRVAQEAARRLVAAQKPGSIINVASILGLGHQTRQSTYAVAKAGVVQLTRASASELVRHGIRVNALAPGYFKTEMNENFFESERGQAYLKTLPMRRLGDFHELDGALLLLASDASSFMTGVTIPVDGGHLIRSL